MILSLMLKSVEHSVSSDTMSSASTVILSLMLKSVEHSAVASVTCWSHVVILSLMLKSVEHPCGRSSGRGGWGDSIFDAEKR